MVAYLANGTCIFMYMYRAIHNGDIISAKQVFHITDRDALGKKKPQMPLLYLVPKIIISYNREGVVPLENVLNI